MAHDSSTMSSKTALTQAISLGVVGLLVGALGGWFGVIRADGAEAVSAAASPFGYALIVAVPLGLFLLTYFGGRDPQAAAALPRTGALLGWLGAVALIGAVAASALFLVTTTQIPAIFAGEEAASLMRANRANFGWAKTLLVAGATLTAAVPIALWLKRRAQRQPQG